jgi:hypothetical protein
MFGPGKPNSKRAGGSGQPSQPFIQRGVCKSIIMVKSLALVLGTSALLLVGCGKTSHGPRAGDPKNLVDWGVVELSVNAPKHLRLGPGKDCLVSAVPLSGGDLQITIQTKEQLAHAELPPGAPAGSRVESTTTQTTTVPPDVEIVISVGSTPVRLKAEFKG